MYLSLISYAYFMLFQKITILFWSSDIILLLFFIF